MEKEDKNNREIIPMINSSDVEALMSAIIKRQIMVDRFRFNLTAQKAFDLLTACYRITVENRQRTFREDDNLQENKLAMVNDYFLTVFRI